MGADISGVYEIVNRTNGHKYIGSALNIKTRWNGHKRSLRKGRHHSIYLQRAWDKYGEDAFRFTTLCKAKGKDNRLEIEQEYMDNQNPEYNMCPVAKSRLGAKASPATVKKLREVGKNLPPERREQMRQIMLTKAIPAAIAWHKSKAGQEWHKQNYLNNLKDSHVKHTIICDQCRERYEAEKGRFCSNKCKSKYRRNTGIDNIVRACVVCSNQFTVNKYSQTETCSKSCASKLI